MKIAGGMDLKRMSLLSGNTLSGFRNAYPDIRIIRSKTLSLGRDEGGTSQEQEPARARSEDGEFQRSSWSATSVSMYKVSYPKVRSITKVDRVFRKPYKKI